MSGDDSLRRALQIAVGDRYEIIRLLGRGGMGAVYLARDTLERLVAIKVILPHAFVVPGARERFRREMRTVARFAHPNIVPIYASGELNELDYFVMMYVSGDTIAERLRQEGRLPVEEVRRILVDLADALHYAHGLGVVHRDIKPANVLIDDMSGRAYLTDFGVAKTLSEVHTQSAPTMAGTMGYMPPEAFGGATVDHRADIYSLGVLGYEMIAGRRPFVADSAVEIMAQTIKDVPPSLSALSPDVPPDLEAVLMRCLAKNPADRARDARHLRGALGVKETDEETMPQDLRDMAGFGGWTVLWIAVWGTFGMRALHSPVLSISLFLIALIVPVGFSLQVASMRPGGLPLLQIARVAFWPPKWWGMWWPRRLRRPVDLWRYLPARAKSARIALSAFLVIVPALVLFVTEKDFVSATRFIGPMIGVVIGVLATALVAVLADAWLWGRREGLSRREIVRMLIGPTIVSRLWDSPQMSALLARHLPAPTPDAERRPDFPRECMHKIKSIAQDLTGRSRESGAIAVIAARELCSQIDALDVEISQLTDDSQPDMIARLARELADLSPYDHDDAFDAQRRRPRQTELERLRKIEHRLHAARKERELLWERQYAIWEALVELSSFDPQAAGSEAVRTRISRLCAGLEGPEPSTRQRSSIETIAPIVTAPLDGYRASPAGRIESPAPRDSAS